MVGQFGIISAAAMAGLTHGAVALPVIMGQRSEATPYPTIHKGSHTIHNVYTSTDYILAHIMHRVAKCLRYGRYICVKILVGVGVKCVEEHTVLLDYIVCWVN